MKALGLLKKVKPLRQIEIAELMVSAGVYSGTYAQGLVLATPKELRAEGEEAPKPKKIRPEDIARLERESRIQEKHFRMVDESYSENVVTLTFARSYIRSLLENGKVVRYLAQQRREFLAEFQRIAELASLETQLGGD